MDANQLCKRLGRSDRGNRDWARRRVNVGVRTRDWPRSRESAELSGLDCEIERGKQLGRKHGGIEPGIQVRLCLAKCLLLPDHIESPLLEFSIVGPDQY